MDSLDQAIIGTATLALIPIAIYVFGEMARFVKRENRNYWFETKYKEDSDKKYSKR